MDLNVQQPNPAGDVSVPPAPSVPPAEEPVQTPQPEVPQPEVPPAQPSQGEVNQEPQPNPTGGAGPVV